MKNDKDLSILKKKLLYRSIHRGCKEMDIILGKFAINNIFKFNKFELFQYEKIINMEDDDLYYYFCNVDNIPENFIMLKDIIKFQIVHHD